MALRRVGLHIKSCSNVSLFLRSNTTLGLGMGLRLGLELGLVTFQTSEPSD